MIGLLLTLWSVPVSVVVGHVVLGLRYTRAPRAVTLAVLGLVGLGTRAFLIHPQVFRPVYLWLVEVLGDKMSAGNVLYSFDSLLASGSILLLVGGVVVGRDVRSQAEDED